MTTVFITIPWFHPAYKAGGPVQSIANMVTVLDEGFRFFIFCGDTDLNGVAIEVPERNTWLPYNDYTQVMYASKQGRGALLLKEIKKISPDLLYMVGLYAYDFTWLPLQQGKAGRKVLSVRGMLHPGALSQKSLKKKLYIGAMKVLGLQHKCSWQASDAQEADYIRAQFGNVNIFTAGNFPRLFARLSLPAKVPGSLYLISLALISPMKNILLVLQALQQQEATILYHICGPVKDESYWQECQAAIASLPPNIIVKMQGDVPPTQVADILAQGQVFILPSKSENYGHAIIEALSAGLPVITSHHTPWQNLQEEQAGINVDTSPATIGNAIRFFAELDTAGMEAYAAGAASYARKQADIEKIKQAYQWMANPV